VSKRYSECGIRIGALITKNKAVRKAVMKFCQARLSPPLIGQIVAEASLDASEEYHRDVEKGMDVPVPVNYYPGDDPENKPLLTWRATSQNLYFNWLNFYVYQLTPYNLMGTPEFT
ncbi:MAG: homoserine O-succinyltransferase, partial [Mogibacterium sp.]|nr:homoserine O-succinyltransferase [Mogibacterium sp.]